MNNKNNLITLKNYIFNYFLLCFNESKIQNVAKFA